MLQNKQIILSIFHGYLDYLREAQPDFSLETAYQVAAMLTQAETNLQIAESHRQS